MTKPYKSAYGNDGKFYVDGPAQGGECSYYGGTLYSDMRFDTREPADVAAKFANLCYKQGYEAAQLDMQKALGILK